MASKKFVTRTVKNGRVTIAGKVYRPREDYRLYDGQLDGIQLVFGRYRKSLDGYESFVTLWGTVEALKTDSECPGPECVDGVFPWDFWNQER